MRGQNSTQICLSRKLELIKIKKGYISCFWIENIRPLIEYQQWRPLQIENSFNVLSTSR